MSEKTLTIRLEKELHKKLKVKLAQDEKTFQTWAIKKIEDYVEEEGKNGKKVMN